MCIRDRSTIVRQTLRMASANTNFFSYACISTSVTSFVALSTIIAFIWYNSGSIQTRYVPKPGPRLCAWTKHKKNVLRNLQTPPWFALLSDYKATMRFRKNLYLWPVGGSAHRLGNRLFNYAATFGIAWRNRRIPLWP